MTEKSAPPRLIGAKAPKKNMVFETDFGSGERGAGKQRGPRGSEAGEAQVLPLMLLLLPLHLLKALQ